jgi:hypothetical protein
MLEAWLDFHRQTLLGKYSGLTPGQLRQRSAPPSPLSLLTQHERLVSEVSAFLTESA